MANLISRKKSFTSKETGEVVEFTEYCVKDTINGVTYYIPVKAKNDKDASSLKFLAEKED